MADEFEEIYGILLEEVTADDDVPAEAETVEMLIEIAQRDDADDPEVGCMSAWLNTRLGEPSDRVRQKTLRMITQCVTEGEAACQSKSVQACPASHVWYTAAPGSVRKS